MSEKNATEEQITEALNKIINAHEDKAIQLLAKLIFNLRFDLDELKIELLKMFKTDHIEEDFEIDLEFPDKTIDTECKRFYNDFYT